MLVSAGRRWIKIRVRMLSTRNANTISAGSVIMVPTLNSLNQLDISVRRKNVHFIAQIKIELLRAVRVEETEKTTHPYSL